MTFDSKHGVVVLHGGINAGSDSKFGDTWIYSYAANTWTAIDSISDTNSGTTSTETPPPDSFPAIVVIVTIGAVGVAVVIAAVIILRRQN